MSGKAKFTDCNITQSGNLTLLIFEISPDSKYSAKGITQEIKQKKGKIFSLAVAEHRENRSKNANSYCWILCQKIAEVIHSTKELVYQKFIHDVGSFIIYPVENENAEDDIRKWDGIGLGWQAEVLTIGKDMSDIIHYFGSSSYNSKEMAILIDEIVTECKELDIETMSPNELESLKEAWGRE